MGIPHEDGVVAHQRGGYAIALQLWRPLAEQGEPDAQCSLGFMYANGRGVRQDDVTAADWYRKAADQGHPGAQFNLGCMYADGRGVPKNKAAAADWHLKAANQGHAGGKAAYYRLARSEKDAFLGSSENTLSKTSDFVTNGTASVTAPITPSELTWTDILETKGTITQHLTLIFTKLTSAQKIIIAALAGVSLLTMSRYDAPPAPVLRSTCHTVREVEYCRYSDGTYSMTMPDGAFYTRETVNEPWERYYPERNALDGM